MQLLLACPQGEQKLTLIAAAIARRPLLLVLDEPCQGLDQPSRQRVLEVVDLVCRSTFTRREHASPIAHPVATLGVPSDGARGSAPFALRFIVRPLALPSTTNTSRHFAGWCTSPTTQRRCYAASRTCCTLRKGPPFSPASVGSTILRGIDERTVCEDHSSHACDAPGELAVSIMRQNATSCA